MLDKYFNFHEKEKQLSKLWDDHNISKFNEDNINKDQGVFSITMPPPNANGELHLGHCFGHTIMDILGRFHRVLGKETLLLPGKDHAGIQTQVVYERLLKKEGINNENTSKSELYKMCYDFCQDRSNYMRNQEKILGITSDWSKELFTLDPRLIDTINDTFISLYNDGLIYKGNRIVNWSVESQTAISDVEVEYREQKGSLWYFYYPFAGNINHPSFNISPSPDKEICFMKQFNNDEHILFIKDINFQADKLDLLNIDDKDWIIKSIENININELLDSELNLTKKEKVFFENKNQVLSIKLLPFFSLDKGVLIATTRPETLLGDTGIAVHPEDPRYQHLIGEEVKIPLQNRTIKVFADKRVDLTYGTGAVKVTPAHDFLDFDLGKDNGLKVLQVIGPDGKMTSAAGERYSGLTTLECREKAVNDLKAKNLFKEVKEMTHKVPISERAKDIIEPLISDQWFINVDKEGNSLKKNALKVIQEDKINIYPKRFKKEFINWLENLNDWNISRQIWWGPNLPVWYKDINGKPEIHVGKEAPDDSWRQETDTFDTWFSSGQWAFSTLKAHNYLDLENPNNSKVFPSHTMVMGRDILLFWACRMLLLTTYRLKEIPWRNIYFTGLIRDEKGQKMSKSKGNGVDPKEIIDKYGVDALRIGLIIGAAPGSDSNFGINKLEGYAKFINKLWNSAKLIELKCADINIGDFDIQNKDHYQLELSKWILPKINKLQSSIIKKLNNYEISGALDELYNFTWFTFCDWYLEMMKVEMDNGTEIERKEIAALTINIFNTLLKLLHSFIPFVTEEIFQNLEFIKDNSTLAKSVINKEKYCFSENFHSENTRIAINIINDIRSKKAALGLSSALININLNDANSKYKLSPETLNIIKNMGRINFIEDISSEKALNITFSGIQLIYELEDKEKYKNFLEKELNTKERFSKSLESKLNSSFVDKADPAIVEIERKKLKDTKEAVINLSNELSQIK